MMHKRSTQTYTAVAYSSVQLDVCDTVTRKQRRSSTAEHELYCSSSVCSAAAAAAAVTAAEALRHREHRNMQVTL